MVTSFPRFNFHVCEQNINNYFAMYTTKPLLPVKIDWFVNVV